MNDLSRLSLQFVQSKQLRISAILPARNESDSIADRIEAVIEASGHLNLAEIIVVDSASSDLTWGAVQAALWHEPRLRPVRMRKDCGLDGAIDAGLASATGDVVVTLPRGFDPQDMARLVGLIEAGADMAVAARPQHRTGIALSRILRAYGLKLSDPWSGMAAMTLELVRQLRPSVDRPAMLPFAAHGAGFHVTGFAARTGPAAGWASSLPAFTIADLPSIMIDVAGTARVMECVLALGLVLVACGIGLPAGMSMAAGELPAAVMIAASVAVLAGLQFTLFALRTRLATSGRGQRGSDHVAERLLRHAVPD